MSDQCMHCMVRGDFEACQKTECYQHENWYAEQLQQKLDYLYGALNQLGLERDSAADKLQTARARLQEIDAKCTGNALPLTLPTIIKAIAAKGLEESK
jgi:hypothetical protein